MANMIPISTVTVGSTSVATIDFTGIPQTYTDLVIKASVRTSGTNPTMNVYMNGDTVVSGGNNAFRSLYGDGASAVSNNGSQLYSGYVNQSTDTSNTFSNTEIYIPNYNGATNKSWSVDSVSENNATTAYTSMWAKIWLQTAPINRVTLSLFSGNFVQYSTATLYGIRKY
jgi:hypothetical protein